MSLALSGDRMLDCLLYGVPTEQTRRYFQNELDQFRSYVGNDNHWALRSLDTIYQNVYSQEAVNNAQWCLRNSSAQFRDDILHFISYNAYRPNLITQQYIMACPEVWNLRLKGLSNDFNLTYVDNEPEIKDITWRDDYIKVVDGFMDYDKNGEGVFVNYRTENEEEFSTIDQLVNLSNWDVVRNLIANHKDPTII